MKLYLVYEDEEAELPEDTVKAYVEIGITKQQLLELPSEAILNVFIAPALFHLRQGVGI